MKTCNFVIMIIMYTRKPANAFSYWESWNILILASIVLNLCTGFNFNIMTQYGNVSSKNKAKLVSVVNTASKLTGNEQKHMYSKYNASLKRKASQN